MEALVSSELKKPIYSKIPHGVTNQKAKISIKEIP
jgi:hypothetical protein